MNAPFSRDLYMRAWHFAAARHNGQKVPGSELPYITHVGAVAMEVLATIALDVVASPDLAVACALLHDTVEDTETTTEEIAAAFGLAVADGVRALSKDKDIPKAEQMADSLRRIQQQPREIWIVKLADRAVNMEPAPAHWSMEKRRAYKQQAVTILEQLGSASPSLAARLREKIARYEAMNHGETSLDTLECCSAPSLLEIRELGGSPRKGLRIERCPACGAHRLHAWEEISMGDFDNEVDFDTYARLTPEEAARIPESPSAADLAFLDDRTVFFTGVGGLQTRKGWPR